MLDLAAAHNGIHVWVLGAYVGERNASDLRVLLLGEGLERLGHGDVFWGRGAAAALLIVLALLFGGEVAAAEGAPGADGHALVAGHGEDFALEVALCGGPAALVDGEAAEAVVAGVW